MTRRYESFLPIVILLSMMILAGTPLPAAAYSPHQGDRFSYSETINLGNGTGSYAGYSEQETVTGSEDVTGVAGAVVSTSYIYSYNWSNSTGGTSEGSRSGAYTWSSNTFLYVNGTDDQTGYVNPSVWFAMNSSAPEGSTFYLLNTLMTVESTNYSYYLPSLGKDVGTIFAHGVSSYDRDDVYGQFDATYTWDAYFDPTSGYIVGYNYAEHDTNSSGTGFDYVDTLYVTSTSYPLTTLAVAITTTTSSASAGLSLFAVFIVVAAIVVVIVGILIWRRDKRRPLPQHPSEPAGTVPPSIDLTPREQPPVQQVVIREVAMVKCQYCGTLFESTAQVCPRCGAPRT